MGKRKERVSPKNQNGLSLHSLVLALEKPGLKVQVRRAERTEVARDIGCQQTDNRHPFLSTINWSGKKVHFLFLHIRVSSLRFVVAKSRFLETLSSPFHDGSKRRLLTGSSHSLSIHVRLAQT